MEQFKVTDWLLERQLGHRRGFHYQWKTESWFQISGKQVCAVAKILLQATLRVAS
jgi:hypothetical protein